MIIATEAYNYDELVTVMVNFQFIPRPKEIDRKSVV